MLNDISRRLWIRGSRRILQVSAWLMTPRVTSSLVNAYAAATLGKKIIYGYTGKTHRFNERGPPFTSSISHLRNAGWMQEGGGGGGPYCHMQRSRTSFLHLLPYMPAEDEWSSGGGFGTRSVMEEVNIRQLQVGTEKCGLTRATWWSEFLNSWNSGFDINKKFLQHCFTVVEL